MSQAQTLPAALPAQTRTLVSASAETVAIPWNILTIVTAISIGMVGGTWDFAWHMSIGRDVFWTTPHILVQLGALMSCIASASAIAAATLNGGPRTRDASVRVLGFYGPGGAFIVFWGSLSMMASAPFDNWWHNAYGLDSRIVTPPHLLLSLGYFAVQWGAMVWMAGVMNRCTETLRNRLAWLFMIMGGVSVALFGILILPLTIQRNMHTAACYLAVALLIPGMLITAGRGSAHRWGCTIVAAVYTAIGLTAEWVVPLFPAQPKLGPVYQNITHLIPLQLPLLLIVPALVTDLLLRRLEGRSSWLKAVWAGPAFVLSFLAVQWPFAIFLLSPASRNWIFGTAYFSYFDPAGFLYDPYKFRVLEKTSGAFALTMVAALLASILTTRLGLGCGGWMRRVRR